MKRTIYGPQKYAAFHLLFARWLRHYAVPTEYRYVTLGGTELKDIQSVFFIDPRLAVEAVSFEKDHERCNLAGVSSQALEKCGVIIQIVERNIFDFERSCDGPHIFFVDLEGICAGGEYHLLFAEMFRKQSIRENDALFITSYCGRHPGWERQFRVFDAEFRILGVTDAEKKKEWYRRAHPSFTLFRALSHADLQSEIALHSLGCVEYRDSSPMGLYGYTVEEGITALGAFVQNAPRFHVKKGYVSDN